MKKVRPKALFARGSCPSREPRVEVGWLLEQTPIPNPGVLVLADDEFEDFQQEDWEPGPDELKRKQLWDKTWDNDDLEDHIGQQLRQHLPQAYAQQPPQPQQ